jgi:CRISPR system Cascade subunit CasB
MMQAQRRVAMADKKLRFLTEDDQRALLTWHKQLTGQQQFRAARAHLRRAGGPEGVLLSEAFFQFLERLTAASPKWRQPDTLLASGMLAGLLSHVSQNDASHLFAAQLARPAKAGERSPLSTLRFQSLQKSASPEDFYRNLMNAIKLLRGTANVSSLADSILHWLDEYQHFDVSAKPLDRLAVQWASDYYLNRPKSD